MDNERSKEYTDKVLNTCLMAGKIMIQSGSEMYRVEDTINRIAKNSGIEDSVIFSTPTGIFVGINHQPVVELAQLYDRSINLEKVDRVNRLSRAYAENNITLHQLHDDLIEIDRHTPEFSLWLQTLGVALLSSTLMILFMNDYNWVDFPITAIVGSVGYLAYYFINKYTNVKFLSELLAAMIVALLAVLSVRTHIGSSTDAIIVGSVMPLVPGLAITNSLRDLFAGHLLTGLARGMEAILTAIAIGAGVAIVIRFFIGV